MITVAGGKLTTYRLMAAQVVDHLVKRLNDEAGAPGPPTRGTELEPLPGGESASLATIRDPGHRLRDRRRHAWSTCCGTTAPRPPASST